MLQQQLLAVQFGDDVTFSNTLTCTGMRVHDKAVEWRHDDTLNTALQAGRCSHAVCARYQQHDQPNQCRARH